ncbi:MAG: hypothetical protein EXR72_01465 [Myxococcales bacterium]|nr:hypothetical protein [Myxococcales bacterium]
MNLKLWALPWVVVALVGCGEEPPVATADAAPADLAALPSADRAPAFDGVLLDQGPADPDLAVVDSAEGEDALSVDGLIAADAASSDGAADLALPACEGTPQSCGAPGACQDCTGNSGGSACVAKKCGCAGPADCPKGSACDPKSAVCSQACAGALLCNGGCCDGATCRGGNENGACGTNGGVCAPCGGATPTCAGGACTASCVAGGVGQPGVCAKGFCCSAQNQCAAVGDGACAVAGGACVDCAKSGDGPVCLIAGACGCLKAADCPPGRACASGVCTTACDANTPCSGGCCDAANKKCVAGTAQAACALGALACGSCANSPAGTACLAVGNPGANACGCKSAADCPPNTACDPITFTCGAKCDGGRPCNSGCCSAAQNGTCAKGLDPASKACGNNGGVCVDCTGNANGHLCVASGSGGACGCSKFPDDCPVSSTGCANKVCNNQCDANNKCLFGCCAGGTCANGTAAGVCFLVGMAACFDCTSAASGHLCRPSGNGGNSCGCDKAGDCPVGLSCNAATHACEAKCGPNQPCNGGCCAGGACVPGNAASACGSAGLCVDCSASPSGHACAAGNGGAACGCNKAAECGPLQACDVAKHLCTSACNANQLCSAGCCAGGTCTPGSSNSACGASGGACIDCQPGASATPTCVAGTCGGKCGGGSDGVCGAGNCCGKAGQCTSGKLDAACGFSGACQDCTQNSLGHRCRTPLADWTCACDVPSDCFAATGNQAGQSCDAPNHVCTSECAYPGATACNGGCCLGGQCRPGTQDNACGALGTACQSCAATCNTGPRCSAKGACGCDQNAQCAGNATCTGGGANRLGCNLNTLGCCIPGVAGFKDNGNPANCCTGASLNGACTCFATATSAKGSPASCCTQRADGLGNCICLNKGQACAGGYECCSGTCGGGACQ